MSNRRGNGDFASKGKAVSDNPNPMVEQLSAGVSEVSLGSEHDDGGDWEVYGRKSKNRAGNASKPSAPQNSNTRTWGQPEVVHKPAVRNYNGSGGRASGNGLGGRATANAWSTQPADFRRALGRGSPRPPAYNRGFEQNSHHGAPPQPVARAPLEHGWNWQQRVGADVNEDTREPEDKDDGDVNVHEEDEDDDVINDSDDDFLSDDDDGDDSDSSKKSHGTRKKNRCFKNFFEMLEDMFLEDINNPERQWHCPACRGGPGAIDWYRGLQPLITHAKTIGSNRVKLHREFAEVLTEELMLKGAQVNPSGGMFGKWKGLMSEEKDHEIVWPPMIIVMNTQLDQDENEKWIGMGNQELLDYFGSYEAVKARHAYGPQGHRGMSLLIFEGSAAGYLEAERLHKHFQEEGRDREAWDHRRRVFHHSGGGKRQLYGYLAIKEDLDLFNRHSQGKSKTKFELKSYQEYVVSQIKKMSEDNQRLLFYKNKVAKEKMHSKALEESLGNITQRLKKTESENKIVRQRSKIHHEQNREEMEYHAKFFTEQLQSIMEERDAKEDDFEKQQEEKRLKLKESNANPSNAKESSRLRSELQDKEREIFEEEREKLIKEHDEKIAEMKRRHWEEEVKLENEYNEALSKLMDKYSDSTSK